MSTDSQRIAIAEACGIVSKDKWGSLYKTPRGILRDCPDYLNDLNAMHDAEKVLDIDRYVVSLCQVHGILQTELFTGNRHGTVFLLLHSNAAQRAEAFLKTLNLWEGAK